MLLLALDTAGPDCAVALARGEARSCEIPARRSERIGRGHADILLPLIDAVLGDCGCRFEDLERIAVGIGPGSFTGVRVGIAAARALALALDIPAVGVDRLAALSVPVCDRHRAGTVVAALEAGRGEIFVRATDLASGAVLLESRSARPAEIGARLSAAERPLFAIGSAARQLAAALEDVSVVAEPDAPDIEAVARLGLRADDSEPPAPLYLRGADAKPQRDKALAHA